LPSDASVTYTGNDQTDAGTYTVTAIVTQANYEDLELTAELKINKAASVITSDATQTFTYDGTAKSVSGTLNHSETTISYDPQQSYIDAGSYSITLKAAETINYLESSKTVTLKINPATIIGVTLTAQTYTYNGAARSLAVTGLPEDATITYQNNDQTNAGTYTITATVKQPNHSDLVLTAELKINKALGLITADATQTFTYDGTAKSVSGTLNHSETTISYDPQQSYTDAGSYSITLNAAETANYLESSKTVTLKINPATITGVTLADQTFTYDGTAKSLEVTGLPADATVAYTGNDQTAAGTYTVTATVTQDNYADLELTAELKINKAASVITADATQTFTYDGTAKSVTGTLNHSETTLSYDPQQSYTDAGSYSITLQAAETTNYLESSKTVTLKINPATITGVTLTDQTFTYDGTAKSIEVTGLPVDATIAYLGNEQTNAGTYTITATIKQTNYNDLELTAELKINKAASVITANATQTFTYDGTGKSVTGTLNHSEANISYDPQQSYTNAGSYSITLQAAETTNYLESSKTVTLKINKATITGVTLTDQTFTYDGTAKGLAVTGLPTDATVAYSGNGQVNVGTYVITATVKQPNFNDLILTGRLILTPATITGVTLTDQTYIYDATAKSLAVSGLPARATVTYTGNSQTNVGTYVITATVKQPNFNDLILTGRLTLIPATITGVALTNQSYVYDATAKNIEVSGLPPGASVIYTGNAQTNAGNYPVTAVVKLANHKDLTLNAELTILQAVLTITANNQTKVYGQPNPPLTLKYDGFAANENESVLLVQPSVSTVATPVSPIGTYPIIAEGASAANYSISYVPGILKINPAAPATIALAAVTVFENRPAGTLVGTLSSTSDDPAAEFSYSLVSGSGDTDNSLFAVSGTRLITSASLDFENKAVYSVRLRSTTQHGFYLDQVFNINISNVNEIPTMAVISDQTICYTQTAQSVALTGITAGPDAGQNVTLTLSSTNAGLFESLTVNKGTGSAGTLNYRIKAGSSGTAVVTIVVKDDGGTANDGADTYSRSFVITVNALSVVAVTSNVGLSLSKGETAVLTATGGVSYRWSSASGIISGQNTAVLTIRPDETATYQVTATNASGCTDVQTITIEVLSDYMAIRTTNILTPNGDGKNDYFIVENIDKYPNNELKVFDRAGRVLFEKRNYDNSFDAIISGSPLTEGTYYYILDFGNAQPKKKGFITVVRN
ncbi:MBG domain-containing protein, partial [Pedobacter metabolipauper]|uniref:MBG domain-containing protein n=1 Tax=Pedobacter metabolipauper TaxID=425513 RepID=UPI001414F358